MLIDSHVHLDDERLQPLAEGIISNLAVDGLECVINASSDRASCERGIELAKHENVYCLVGTHPHDSRLATSDDYAYYADCYINNCKVVGVGEIGLDYFYDLSPREVQCRVFVEQLELASGLGAPVCIHLRDAYGDMLELLKQNKDKLGSGILLHCYSGSSDYAKELLRLGDFYFAFGGSLTFRNARNAVETISTLPRDRILLETDCPYLAPVPLRGTTNVPANVRLVAERAAEILGISAEEMADTTALNTKRFFRRIK